MHKNGMGSSLSKQFLIHLKFRKGLFSLCLFRFLSHTRPYVSIHDICFLHSLLWIRCYLYMSPVTFSNVQGFFNNRRMGSEDRKSTRLNSSHVSIAYAVFC